MLLDGGRGQLTAGDAALSGAPWRPRLLLAIAKPSEKRGTDAIFVAGGGAALPSRRGAPVLLLLQRVRDEAHRFAVAYHRTLRSRRLLAGPLDGHTGPRPGAPGAPARRVRRAGRGAGGVARRPRARRPGAGRGGGPRGAAPGRGAGAGQVRRGRADCSGGSLASPDWAAGGSFGSEMKKVLPCPGVLSTQI